MEMQLLMLNFKYQLPRTWFQFQWLYEERETYLNYNMTIENLITEVFVMKPQDLCSGTSYFALVLLLEISH